MFCSLSLAISPNCWLRRLLVWLQAKSVFLGPVVSRASMSAKASKAAGKADTETVAERRRTAMEVSCILMDDGGRELHEVVRDRQQ